MSLSLIVVALGAVVAAVGTGVLTARCARGPRIYLVACAIGLFGLAISQGAQTLGYLTGYSAMMFRAMELGAQVLAPLAFCLVIAELVGKTVPARFAMRLAVAAIAAIAVVILGTDPLNPVATFSKRWPDPAVFYEVVPKALIEYLIGPFTALVAVMAILIALWRSRRDQPARDAVLPVAAAACAALALAVPGLALLARHSGVTLPAAHRVFGPACLVAAGLAWLAGARAERIGLGDSRAARGAGDWDDADGYADPDGYAVADGYASADRYGGADGYASADGHAGADGYAGQHDWPDQGGGLPGGYGTGDFDRYGADADQTGGRYPPDQAAVGYDPASLGREPEFGGNGHDAAASDARFVGQDADGPYPELAALVAEATDLPGGAASFPEAGRPGAVGPYGDPGPLGVHSGPKPADDDPRAHLFGQIAIYTLIEDRIDDFDRLTERVVAQVRAREPDTLVYIVHAVPTAPMQRILYEVYRDRAAYDLHMQQPYVARYEAERRPFVLAANVIELGLQQAKVSPLPSISDILSESGIDLTGVTRSPRGVAPPPSGDFPLPQSLTGPADWLPAAVPPAPIPPSAGQAREPGYDRPSQGWADLRGDEPPYR
ncbi:MAG TPA: antibiotic biosynthesis monooxygenase [Streptosporangiaceae bacterium]|nr:antibiotic biosynthesis monooxygenase [Streptosporangiaceae bacterium]